MKQYKGCWFLLGDKKYDYRNLKNTWEGLSFENGFLSKKRMVLAEQTHSATAIVVTEEHAGAGFYPETPEILNCDALITQTKGLFLISRTADCVPVLLYDEYNQVIAAIHSGREGTRKAIVEATIQKMREGFQTTPDNIKAWIGASICAKHYEVDEMTYWNFAESTQMDQDPYQLDLTKVIQKQLIQAGIDPKSIEHHAYCTYEDTNYYSYRRDHTNNRQLAIIGLNDGTKNFF